MSLAERLSGIINKSARYAKVEKAFTTGNMLDIQRLQLPNELIVHALGSFDAVNQVFLPKGFGLKPGNKGFQIDFKKGWPPMLPPMGELGTAFSTDPSDPEIVEYGTKILAGAKSFTLKGEKEGPLSLANFLTSELVQQMSSTIAHQLRFGNSDANPFETDGFERTIPYENRKDLSDASGLPVMVSGFDYPEDVVVGEMYDSFVHGGGTLKNKSLMEAYLMMSDTLQRGLSIKTQVRLEIDKLWNSYVTKGEGWHITSEFRGIPYMTAANMIGKKHYTEITVAPTGVAAATTGGTFLQNTDYTFVIAQYASQGGESICSPEFTVSIGATGTDTNTITINVPDLNALFPGDENSRKRGTHWILYWRRTPGDNKSSLPLRINTVWAYSGDTPSGYITSFEVKTKEPDNTVNHLVNGAKTLGQLPQVRDGGGNVPLEIVLLPNNPMVFGTFWSTEGSEMDGMLQFRPIYPGQPNIIEQMMMYGFFGTHFGIGIQPGQVTRGITHAAS